MATRDLTHKFLERRNAAIRKRSSSSSGVGGSATSAAGRLMDGVVGGGDTSYAKLTAGGTHDLMLAEEGSSNGVVSSVELTDLRRPNGGGTTSGSLRTTPASQQRPPAWVQHVEAVETCLMKIQRMMEQLQSMHANRVGSIFGKDLADMEGKIERYTRDITDQFRVAESSLQKVGMATKRASQQQQMDSANGGEQTATVGANVQRSLAKRLQELSVTFRQSQRKYLAEVQAQKSGSMAPKNGGGGMSSSTSTSTSNVDSKFGIDLGIESGDYFTTQQLAVVDDLTEAVQSRDNEIAKIAQSIEELGTIFKELAVLVIDQGTILDRIDYNMEAVVEHTKTGIKQLEKAEKHQKSARPMRCIICLSITIFILLFILVLKHRPHHH